MKKLSGLMVSLFSSACFLQGLFCVLSSSFFCVHAMRDSLGVKRCELQEQGERFLRDCLRPLSAEERSLQEDASVYAKRVADVLYACPAQVFMFSARLFFDRYGDPLRIASSVRALGIDERRVRKLLQLRTSVFPACSFDDERCAGELCAYAKNGRRMGSVKFLFAAPDVEIKFLRVEPNFYDRGIGSILLNCILHMAKNDGKESARLFAQSIDCDHMSQESLVNFYQSFGFVIEHDGGDEGCDMVCRLK